MLTPCLCIATAPLAFIKKLQKFPTPIKKFWNSNPPVYSDRPLPRPPPSLFGTSE